MNYEGLNEVRNCFSRGSGKGGNLLICHFSVRVEFRVTCLTQHFAKYLSGVAI